MLIKHPVWQARIHRFRRNRLGFFSLIMFSLIFLACMGANLIANDKPMLVNYQNQWYFPIVKSYPETTFGGVFETETNYQDPVVKDLINQHGYMIEPVIPFADQTPSVMRSVPFPAPPNSENWLGTDDQGRDVLARVLYGLRVSLLFGLVLTVAGSIIGITVGAVQGYFGGWTDLVRSKSVV